MVPTFFNAISVVAFTPLMFHLTQNENSPAPFASAAQPLEQWKQDYKQCVYSTCTDYCQTFDCGECTKECSLPTIEGGQGFSNDWKGMNFCLKNCKLRCPKIKSFECDSCRLNCKNEHKYKRTPDDIVQWRTWKNSCKNSVECGSVCKNAWNDEVCRKCRQVYC